MSSLTEWVASRTPVAPTELRDHLLADLHANPATLVDASLGSLTRVLQSGAATRDSALDLLSADAFVTYAFEAAADEPGSVSERAAAAMRLISDRAVTFLERTQS